MLPRILDPSGDDWIVRVRCRMAGRTFTRWVGVSGNGTDEASALYHARIHVNTPRTVAEGRAATILDMEAARMWEWRARAIVAQAPPEKRQEVAQWNRAPALSA